MCYGAVRTYTLPSVVMSNVEGRYAVALVMRKSSVLTVGTFVISKSAAKVLHFFELRKCKECFFGRILYLQTPLYNSAFPARRTATQRYMPECIYSRYSGCNEGVVQSRFLIVRTGLRGGYRPHGDKASMILCASSCLWDDQPVSPPLSGVPWLRAYAG